MVCSAKAKITNHKCFVFHALRFRGVEDGSGAERERPIAVAGQVYCYADASAGAIQTGDLLTSSSRPGHAMRVDPGQAVPGSVVAKALEDLPTGSGLIRVWVMNR